MTKQLRVAVTGASGYVGSRVGSYLRKNGLQVVELNRVASGAGIHRFALGEEPSRDILSSVSVLVHCAYDFSVNTWDEIERVNVNGSLKLFAAARAAGVRRIIFISTLSAFRECASMYGRSKLMIEDRGRGADMIVIRPGLVHDEGRQGGVVGAMSKLIGLTPILPIVGRGKQVLYPCHSEDLARLVFTLAVNEFPVEAPIPAACQRCWYFRDVLRALAVGKGKRRFFVSVPFVLPLAGLRFLELLGIKLRLRSDSLVGLLNQNPNVDFSQLNLLGVTFRDFQV